jgi:hypothetical protein
MSAVEDVRQVLQDFLAPELRAISTRLEGQDKRLDAMEKVAEARHNEMLVRIQGLQNQLTAHQESTERRFDQLQESFQFDKRLERLEAAKAS